MEIDNKLLLKPEEIEKIATDGRGIYDEIKSGYEPVKNNKFLAIDIDTKEVFEGSSSAEAIQKAKEKYPKKIFYVVKIGESTVETIAQHKNQNA